MIKKDLYFNCIETLKQYDEFEGRIYKASDRAIDFLECKPISKLVDMFRQLLEYTTKDKDTGYGSNLSYFMYDLDYGRNWKPGTITDSDGNDLKLATMEDLWNNFIIVDNPDVDDKSDSNESSVDVETVGEINDEVNE